MDTIRSRWTPDSRNLTNVHETDLTHHFIQRSEWTPSTFVHARWHPWHFYQYFKYSSWGF